MRKFEPCPGSQFLIIRGGILKPIIFLDFDGVVETIFWERDDITQEWTLNARRYNKDRYLNNTQAIGWLNELYNEIPYDIVISSTWRMGMSIEQLQELLIRSGFRKDIKVIGKTPILHQQRGLEIQKWLDDNNFKGKFIIIDDDSDMCHLIKYLVRTDCQLGFTIYDHQKALNLLS